MAAVSLVATAGIGCGRQVASSAGPGPVVYPSNRGLLYFKVSDRCSRGTRVGWTPAKAATLVEHAPSKDGLDAAVVLRPMSRTAHPGPGR